MALTDKERAKRYRDGKRDAVTENRDEIVTKSESVTVEDIASITGAVKVEGKYPPIIYALADPERREKLRTICQHLSVKGKTNYLKNVWYGCGYKPVTMSTVDRLLEAVE